MIPEPLLPEAAEELAALERACFGPDAFNRRQLRYLLAKANGECWGLKENDEVAAYMILLKRKGSARLRIYSLAVAPAHRGRGLAKRLLEWAEERARALGMKTLGLEVREGNLEAVRLYEKAGFLREGRREGYYADGSSASVMAKSVASGSGLVLHSRHF